MKKCNDTVSEICNKLADKHDLNVTVVRDLVEDLRRMVFRKSVPMAPRGAGIDIYCVLKDQEDWLVDKLTTSRKPAAKAARRGK